MIVLLSFFMSLSINSYATDSSTGGIPEDSVIISKVNGKLIELEYEKSINRHLSTIITNDSIAIRNLNFRINMLDRDYSKRINEVKKQRDTAVGISIGAIVLLIISIL